MKKLLVLATAVLLCNSFNLQAAGVVNVTTPQEFTSLVQRPKTVVMFGSDSCPHCRKMRPLFNQVAQENPSITFVFVEAFGKTLSDLLYQYKVKGIPHFKVFKNGTVVAEVGGELSKTAMEAFIKK